ncbi:MAG: hypothetical protein ACRD1Z_02225, partial [Vicinamibacteria bacterium]
MRWWLLGLALELPLALLVAAGEPTQRVPLFLLLFFAAFIPYGIAVRLVSRSAGDRSAIFAAVLGFAILFRVTLLSLPPSDDVHRYVWEGKIQAHGKNPYAVPPDAPELAPLRDDIWSGINHKNLTAIYPPLMEAIFRFVASISTSVTAMKIAFVAADLFCCLLLVALLHLKRLPVTRVLVYAWNPLVLFEISGRGHNDSAFVLLFLYSVFLGLRGRRPLQALALGLATMAKWVSLPFVALLWRDARWKGLPLFAAVVLLLLLPYAAAGPGIVRSLFYFAGEMHFNDSVHAILAVALPWATASRVAGAAAFIGVVVWVHRRGMDWIDGGLWIFGALILLSPTVHPWYLVWIVPFLCFRVNTAWLALT